MNRKFRLYLSVGLVVLLAFIVSQAIKLENITDIIWNFPKEQLILFIGLSLTISLLKAWRFLLLLHNAHIPINLWEASKVYIASQTTTPLPGGETLRAILVHHETDKPIKNTAGAILTQGFLEIFSATVIMIIGSFYYEGVRIPGLIVLTILVIVSAIILNESLFRYLINKLPDKRFFSKTQTRLKFIQKSFLININDPRHSIFKTFIVSICTHLLGGLLVYAIAHAYGVPLNYFAALFIYAAGIVIQGLSTVIPGGLGVTEGGMTGLLLLSNVTFPTALAIVILYRIVTLLFSVLLGAVVFIIFYAYELLLMQQKSAHKQL